MIGFRVGDRGVGVGGLISPTHRCLCLLDPMHPVKLPLVYFCMKHEPARLLW